MTKAMLVMEPVRHLLESRADTETIQAAFIRATGQELSARRVREWRLMLGRSLPRGVRHDLAPPRDETESEALRIQALTKKYWNPTHCNPLLC